MKPTLIAVAVAAAWNDDGVCQKAVTEQTQQLARDLLIIVLNHTLRTVRLHKWRLLLLTLLVRIPVQPQSHILLLLLFFVIIIPYFDERCT